MLKPNSLYTDTNPILQGLKDLKNVLLDQKIDIEQRIKNLPIAQQRYIDLYRDVETLQLLYSELANKSLSYSIIEASTIGNIRIVDDAYVSSIVSPRLMHSFIIVVLATILGLIVAILRGIFLLPISNPAEISDSGIDAAIYGVLPFFDETSYDESDKIALNRSVESTILNIESHIDESIKCNTLLISSPTENNGKTFISKSIAEQLAQMGKKVLLIDNDLIKGDLVTKFKKSNLKK